jgi:cold shock CspA family protein
MIDDFDVETAKNMPPVYYIRLKHQLAVLGQPSRQPRQPLAHPWRHATGKVHNLKLGFGFIAPDDGSENVFFHATEVLGCTIFNLRPGDPVEFETGVNERGPLCLES